ncbi:alpha-amylase family glycosyl hydrolase [Mycoplasmopsis alligatoris]|uniref:Alpha amylase, catalytic domain protein n=1 Tax=Mycoplasmopsis alligatoris A21JP2 TaxID=747682 RepID=D4XWP3_9BACT|nr:alpha-amylase family glycosyl hydrolase [Mycoplasmopsis alligatoris]EFF41291.1 alpha amylase, catalytic domain protein [Mycoplasmopsis alligatoris A21JP2]
MNFKNKKNIFFVDFDKKYAKTNAQLGYFFENGQITFNFWQPIAKEVKLKIYNENQQEILRQKMAFLNGLWTTQIEEKYEKFLYKFQIKHDDNSKTLALDPYAKALANFEWNGNIRKLGFGQIINLNSSKLNYQIQKLETNFNNITDPLIYELHVKDFTSLLNQNNFKSKLGTFNCALEKGIFNHLNDLSISHLQLLPLHSVYTVNCNEVKIIKKGQASGWKTNYNWGYDPHNYFAINQSYSSNSNDPYTSILEFKKFVDQAHKHKIGVIVDVVYNHTMTNKIYDKILNGYYYRYNTTKKSVPVNLAPLASERTMVRKMIIDSLIYWVKTYDIDGFRFDLSTFIDKETLILLTNELRKIKPNIVLHGEAWKFTNLNYQDSFTKGETTNNLNFAYFNDTHRDALKGSEMLFKDDGLMLKTKSKRFSQFISSVVGNLTNYNFADNVKFAKNKYDLFADNLGMVLNYVACHDGYTLWDKINLKSDLSIDKKLATYKQLLLASIACQGRQLILAGTELLQSKPCDKTGEEWKKSHKALGEQLFDDQADDNLFCHNTYKTSDFVNGIKWDHLNKSKTKDIYEFCKKLFAFRQNSDFFRISNVEELNKRLKFITVKNGCVLYTISGKNDFVVVMHNFTKSPMQLNNKLLNNSLNIISSDTINNKNELPAHASIIIHKEGKYENN